MDTIGHWIGGELVAAGTGEALPVFDPATGEQTARVLPAGPDEVKAAVEAAKRAQAAWSQTSLAERASVMFRLRNLVDASRDRLARLVTSQHGKVLSDAEGEVARGLECIEYACGAGEILKGSYSRQVSTGVDVHSVREPLGVVAGVTPFNFPVMVPLWMIPNALVAGNAFILKPSEKDPAPSLVLAELLAEAGLPAGAFNVLQGDRVAVDALIDHPDVAAVSFVGSTRAAEHVYQRGTAANKRVQALGGAKNHLVVLPDADLAAAANAAVSASCGSAGERCMAVSVVVAVGDVADPLVERIKAGMEGLRVQAGFDPVADMGPLVTAEHRDKVASYIDAGRDEGAEVVLDGRRLPSPERGFFLGPTLLDRVSPTMKVYKDEIFGPVLSVVRAADLDEAIGVVNANPYGNGVAVFTSDGEAARRFEAGVQVGMVGVNVPIPVPVGYYSFGGWKSSLFGDAAMYGEEGLRFYTRPKVVTSRWSPRPASRPELHFAGGGETVATAPNASTATSGEPASRG
jgi:malonate-semialdehyde dehydrogenase (acetylating)/methylmalonate-semialdehyde dehydrogenase